MTRYVYDIRNYLSEITLILSLLKLRSMNPSLRMIHPNRKICEIYKVLGSFGEVQGFFALRSHTIDTFRVSMKIQMNDRRTSRMDIFCDPLSLLVSSVSSIVAANRVCANYLARSSLIRG